MWIADGAFFPVECGSVLWYAYLNKAFIEMLIFLLGSDVALEEFKGKNAQIVIFKDPETIIGLMKI